jgi:hypothetical protein
MKDVEIQFTIGEALVCAALGLNSPESRDPWTVKERDFVEPENAPSQLDFLLDELLNKYVVHLNPNVKQVINSKFYSFSNILRAIFLIGYLDLVIGLSQAMPTEAGDERKAIAHSTCIHVTFGRRWRLGSGCSLQRFRASL